jgi:hypothetical protein
MMRKWTTANRFNTKHNLSHVLMDGGVLSIPGDKLGEFYMKCIEDVKNETKIFVVEQKTDIYNFFLDIDYVEEDALELNQIESIVRVICDKVNTLGGENCLISVCKPKPKNGKIKTGVHMNWEHFPVNQENAFNLRDHIVDVLCRAYSATKWSEIVNCIDTSVYGTLNKTKGSGFRMPWSHKSVKDRSSGQSVIEGPYLPFMIYRGPPGQGPLMKNGTIEYTPQEISLRLLTMATIRSFAAETAIIHQLKGSVNRKQEGGFTTSQTKSEISNAMYNARLQSFIRLNMDGQSASNVKRIFKSKDAYLIETDSMYCENIKRNHNSNHVWFIVQDGKMRQRCFCQCDTMKGRKNGFCKDFAGREHMLPNSITMEMFPTKKKNRDNIKASILPNVIINNHISISSNVISIYTNNF